MTTKRTLVVLVSSALLAGSAGAVVALIVSRADPSSSRQAEVRQRGASVMPFDLNQTQHIFRKTDFGGIQQVVLRDSADAEQLPLIRSHMSEEREKFLRGDFDDPMSIHGMSMPGVDVLRRSVGRLTLQYRALPNGAELRYETTDPRVLSALYAWFDAQLMDHGADADG
jgi:hypothetical protein